MKRRNIFRDQLHTGLAYTEMGMLWDVGARGRAGHLFIRVTVVASLTHGPGGTRQRPLAGELRWVRIIDEESDRGYLKRVI